MTDKATLLELAARCAATGGDAYLDLEIYKAVDPDGYGDIATLTDAPHYTASLDAAMTLVPEGWWLGSVSQADPLDPSYGGYACVVANEVEEIDRGYGQPPDEDRGVIDAKAATPALALCAAALRARATQ